MRSSGRAIVRAGSVAVLLGLLLLGMPVPLLAAQPGDNFATLGWLHIVPNSSSTPLHTDLEPSLLGSILGVDDSFSSPGTSARVESADTLALIATHFFTSHMAVQFISGIPARVDIVGKGTVAPTGLLGKLIDVNLGAQQNNPLVSVQEWTPVLLLQYYFRPPTSRWHPYISAGISYAWFGGFDVGGAFRGNLEGSFGKVLALATSHPGPTQVRADASRSWNAVYNVGLSYDLTRRLGLAVSASYAPLGSTATIDILSQDGALLADAKTHLNQSAIITAVLINYRFRL
jgi:outer membrane protein